MSLAGTEFVLGITGRIAAYKATYLLGLAPVVHRGRPQMILHHDAPLYSARKASTDVYPVRIACAGSVVPVLAGFKHDE